jgi:hypothetical protein
MVSPIEAAGVERRGEALQEQPRRFAPLIVHAGGVCDLVPAVLLNEMRCDSRARAL